MMKIFFALVHVFISPHYYKTCDVWKYITAIDYDKPSKDMSSLVARTEAWEEELPISFPEWH